MAYKMIGTVADRNIRKDRKVDMRSMSHTFGSGFVVSCNDKGGGQCPHAEHYCNNISELPCMYGTVVNSDAPTNIPTVDAMNSGRRPTLSTRNAPVIAHNKFQTYRNHIR